MEQSNIVWVHRAALFEILALGLQYPEAKLVSAAASGEYAEAIEEIAVANGLNASTLVQVKRELSEYAGWEETTLLHSLRSEYTYMFIGTPEYEVSPYAGIWYAQEIGVEPLLFVNKESMAVERFMHSCGVGQSEGKNEPLDHIATECEFLYYLCLLCAGEIELQQEIDSPEQAYFEFRKEHFDGFSKKFATQTIAKSRIPFYRAVARVVLALHQ